MVVVDSVGGLVMVDGGGCGWGGKSERKGEMKEEKG